MKRNVWRPWISEGLAPQPSGTHGLANVVNGDGGCAERACGNANVGIKRQVGSWYVSKSKCYLIMHFGTNS